MNNFYNEFNDLFVELEGLLNDFSKSDFLQNYFINISWSLFYANLINSFFSNLTMKTIKDGNLPRGKISLIKNEYKLIRKDVNFVLSLTSKDMNINEAYYLTFRKKVRTDFPEFEIISQEIEKVIEYEKMKDYLNKKEIDIKKLGISNPSLNDIFNTSILEIMVKNGNNILPIGKEEKIVKSVINKIVPEFSLELMKELNMAAKEMLDSQKKIRKEFEQHLYNLWKEPLDSYECLIKVSLESGERQTIKLNNITNDQNRSKYDALIKIHARSLQISDEILALLKSGYADGANSRWRSLHELAVISFFLYDNVDEVSRRYLDHEIVRRFKEAEDYKINCKKLGYVNISRKNFNELKRAKEKICEKYNDRFHDDYGWIPTSILPNRNFRSLEEKVNLEGLRPFYNLSCDSVHGGAKGFYRLGLMHEYQNKILLVGPSNYGLADPLRNSAMSLSQITTCLLSLKPDFENLIHMKVLSIYKNDIGLKAVEIQER